jgi:DNA-binding response OmpR family regulator
MQAVLISPHADETNVLQVIMQQAGFIVRATRNLDQAIELWPSDPADFILIVLTQDHPKSLTQLKLLRAHAVVPILLISDPLPDDVYVRALLRHSSGIPFFSLPTLIQKDIQLDPSDRTVRVGEQTPKRLTQLEFRLLYTLMTHVGQIISTEQIVEHVWGYTGEGNRELVRGLVQRVRSKIESNPHQPKYILTEIGIGYYFSR